MTAGELALEQQRAETLATSVGGALAAILGLRPTDQPVKWNAKKGKFMIGRRAVTMETIRRELHRFEAFVGALMRRAATRLSTGLITLDEWRAEMMSLIGSSHVVMAAVGAGSIAAAARSSNVQARIESERKYAAGFASHIETKDLKLPTVKARATSYLLAAAATFAIVHHVAQKVAGRAEARRTTTAAESCIDCSSYAGSWMPIDQMPEIGTLICKNRCRCYIEYR